MRRWLSSLLLICLLASQQGMLLHGLGHALSALQPPAPWAATAWPASVGASATASPTASSTGSATASATASAATRHLAPGHDVLPDLGHRQPAEEACGHCLAFAQLSGAFTATPSTAGLLSGLSHGLQPTPPLPTPQAELPAQRSRGPPALS